MSNKQNEQIAINFAKSMWIALFVIAKKIAFFTIVNKETQIFCIESELLIVIPKNVEM